MGRGGRLRGLEAGERRERSDEALNAVDDYAAVVEEVRSRNLHAVDEDLDAGGVADRAGNCETATGASGLQLGAEGESGEVREGE